MRITPKNIRRFQMGGEMAPEGAPEEQMPQEGGMEGGPEGGAPEGGGDPMQMMAQLAQQALQSQDCQAAMQLAELVMQLIQGGGGAPEGGAPEGEPVYRRGGILVRRIKK